MLWWRGAGWPLPEGVFDLACVVRASNYRGQRDVQVEWIDARPVEAPEIDLRRRLAVIDQRGLDHPLPVLQQIVADAASSSGADAALGQRVDHLGRGRSAREAGSRPPARLRPHPPGTRRDADHLDHARPDGPSCRPCWKPSSRSTVIIFSVDPADTGAEAFLKRLAGLVKYTLEKMGGSVALARLAAATAQRETAVRLGLQWLEARGYAERDRPGWAGAAGRDRIQPTRAKAESILARLRVLLEETAAYRRYFKVSDKENLL